MSADQNKAVIRHLIESYNTRNISLIEALVEKIFSPDFVAHDNTRPGTAVSLEGVKKHISDGLKKTPDQLFTVEDLIAEGDKVALRVTKQWTDMSTGKPVTGLANNIYRLAGGKIAELWQITTQIED